MTARPAPRSSLAGATPAAPPSVVVPAERVGERSAPTAPPVAAPTKYRPKVSFYLDPADQARVRGAMFHTMTQPGAPRTLSDFVTRAVMTEVERLEQAYNGGAEFPPVPPRALPQGRPAE